ncbi:MAG: RagB/SusD family nutrient uptake outer membrane protein [Prolixibacteraceae bacterium]|jgi:hypothetical protein|nr:RagB/SusD family nutrient uptake outer membrane protein [Prolixibacteraceae bacterium]
MKRKIYLLSLFLFPICFGSCDDYLRPYDQANKFDSDVIWSKSYMAEGVLLEAYRLLPTQYLSGVSAQITKDDFVTDDMVTNQLSDGMITMATGGWTSRVSPLVSQEAYSGYYNAIMHLNYFLLNVDRVEWSWEDENKNMLYKRKLKGEAYALRAYYESVLLRKIGGKDAGGSLLGFPIMTSVASDADAAKKTRNTYKECLNRIYADCDSAIVYLPSIWTNGNLTVKEQLVMGVQNLNRINSITARAIKSRVALTAASSSFVGSNVTWLQAAQLASDVMNNNGGLSGLSAGDEQFYLQIRSNTNYLAKANPEILWAPMCRNSGTDSYMMTRESDQFPPSLNGKGIVNPSQNFVNSFGYKNGTPNPVGTNNTDYTNRDPRLNMYVFYNGSVSANGNVIDIKNGADKIDASVTNATRTGYYLKKLLDDQVVIKTGVGSVGKPHFFALFRYTEVLLNFAEAANEHGGPDVNIGGFTARQVVNAIRNRAGIPTSYVDGLDQSGLRTLIRNERRIELCFEGFRFWDLMRWGDLASMNKSVMGYDALSSSIKDNIETRSFKDYMIYGPVPYNETQIYKIVQNKGWSDN